MIHRVRAVGMDNDSFQFCVTSASRRGVEHEVHIDRRSGFMTCTCEDAVCRHKLGHILEPQRPCRHMRAVIHQYEGIL